MNFFSFLAAFLLLNRIRKSLSLEPQHAKWLKTINVACWATGGLFFLVSNTLPDSSADVVGVVYLCGVILFVQKEQDFVFARPILPSYYPFVTVCLFSKAVEFGFPSFYKEWDDYFIMAMLGAVIYIFAVWISYRKNQKELDVERQKRMHEEVQRKIMASRKKELEELVAERTAEITKQKEELQQTVQELQATQAQLIQQEKLASLGELTAGIAHEIQNPLNFVNNFSEVSIELLDELKQGPFQHLPEEEQHYAIEILQDLSQNLEKITHHGKRADSIVKGMLQHSRASTGQKEPTNLNALADEYLRLSYHGLRAKDKTFNATLHTDFDPTLESVLLIPQDFGRVLLNLFNNAFYSVQQKQKISDASYKPQVTVSIKNAGEDIEIRVKDNGLGIPESIQKKILQPFFTTKPTGQGTGLGLSLSHDIIAKGHGGTLDLETEEGQFAEFIIRIPSKKEKEVLI